MDIPDAKLQAKLAKIRLVLMDIDGTLVSSSRASFDNVSNQLRRLKRMNVHFSVATGRTIAGARPVLEQLRDTVGMRMPPAINYNGAVLLSTLEGHLVERHLVSPHLVSRAVLACRAAGLWPLVYTCENPVSGPPAENVFLDDAAPPSVEFNGMVPTHVPDVRSVQADVVAILADTGSAEASRLLLPALTSLLGDHLRVTTSGSRFVEICSHKATKLAAMERLAALHHVSVENVMAIGDNLNDVEMIKAAGVGVAVGNAPDAVRAVADYACNHDSALGVVEALRMLVRVLQLGQKTKNEAETCTTIKQAPRKSPTKSYVIAL